MKNVILTIDTEGHDGETPIERLIWGETAKGTFGIPRIMDIAEAYGARILFFVDIAEAWDYGEDKVADILTYIKKRGHDVGVHIHPDHMMDKKRLFLYEYTYEEQWEIIEKCTDFYTRVLGERPLAFRAGKYGANYDTLDIISKLGYKFDFSNFYQQKWCGIVPYLTKNKIVRYKGLSEIPVTVFQSLNLGGYCRVDKIDAVMNGMEYKCAMDNFPDGSVITLFFHSFSLLKWRRTPDHPTHSQRMEKRFIHALNYVWAGGGGVQICRPGMARRRTAG